MLARLRIENLALIGTVELELAAGLNVLSGESGAGKSVLVDSLSLLVGERAEADAIRSGADRAVVEGLFLLDSRTLRERVARVTGEDITELALRREVLREGRNRCFLAGRLVPAALLREVGELLLELHGQHEHQLLLRRRAQRDLLDAYGGLEDERAALAREFTRWRSAVERLESLRAREQARGERLRVLREEVADIAAAEIEPGAEAERAAEASRLRNVEDRMARAARAAQALSENEPSALDLLRDAQQELRALAAQEPRLAPLEERLAAAADESADVARDIGRYLDMLAPDPMRLAELDRREELLLRLRRRYATDLAGLLERESAARREIGLLEAEGEEGAALEREVGEAARATEARAGSLSGARRRAAAELERATRANLRELGLGEDFQVRFEPLESVEAGGRERIEFLIAPNAGEPPAPLRTIASGGELSRVILALKAALAEVDSVPTLVFDEIDAGIGGRVASRVASKLAQIGGRRQVLAVTHLAQIAAPAVLHLRVEKQVRDRRSRTAVRPLAGEERVDELSRMVAGGAESEASRRLARELLSAAAGPLEPRLASGRRASTPDRTERRHVRTERTKPADSRKVPPRRRG